MIFLIFIYSSIHSFIWLHWVLVAAFRTFDLRCRTCDLSVAACRIFSSGMQTISSSMWDLVPCPGIKPRSPAWGAQSLSHWTTRKVPPLTVIPCSYLHPQATTDYFLSPRSSLFWTFCTNGIIQYIIIQYVVFVSGFFHSALMFLRFIHIVGCISIPLLLLLNIPSYGSCSHF